MSLNTTAAHAARQISPTAADLPDGPVLGAESAEWPCALQTDHSLYRLSLSPTAPLSLLGWSALGHYADWGVLTSSIQSRPNARLASFNIELLHIASSAVSRLEFS